MRLVFTGRVAGQNDFPAHFAIPTKDKTVNATLPLVEIEKYVKRFIGYANYRPNLKFNVTRIGCGIAGYTDKDIAPMFKDAPENCILPDGWRDFNKKQEKA